MVSRDVGTEGRVSDPPLRVYRRLIGTTWASLLSLAILALAVEIAFLANEKNVAGDLGFSSDDAWIHFRFAQNLISGHGFSYNTDQPVAGSTAPLWTLVCAAFLLVFGDPVIAGKVAGFVTWVLLLWGVFRLVKGLTGSAMAAWGAAVLTLTHQRAIWGALSGLEVMLYSALIVWAMHWHFRASEDERVPYFVVTTLLILAGLTRPELFALAPVFWIDRWWVGRKTNQPHRARGREIAISMAVAACLLVPYFAFNFWTIGKPLPLTFYAKVTPSGLWGALSGSATKGVVPTVTESGLKYLRESYTRFLFLEFPAMIGCWYLWWRLRAIHQTMRRKLFLLLGIPLYYVAVSAIFTSGLLGAFGRYIIFLYPLFCVIAAVAAWDWLTEKTRVSNAFLFSSALLTLILLVFVMTAAWGRPPINFTWVVVYPLFNYMPASIITSLDDATQVSGRTVAFLLGPLLACGLGLVWVARGQRHRRSLVAVLSGLWMLITVAGLPGWARVCSWAVKNTNDINVAAGKWLERYVPGDATLAVNDIGAIGYYAGRRTIHDLMGLVEPDILPYRKRGEQGLWEYIVKTHPDYLAIFDPWFPRVAARTDVLERVHTIHAENYSLWGHHTLSIYKAHWERVDPKRLQK